MAEFSTLPLSAGGVIPRAAYNELLNAINNRRAVVLPDATAAFTIYNSSTEATLATVEIDTAADEICLIVIGGANASNTTLNLNHADYDTITKLVIAINTLGFGWVAVEMSGAQLAHANNKSQTLLTLGPANVLGTSHTTWFTNYAPNGVIVGKLYGHIAAYRAAIDALVVVVPFGGYFWTTGNSDTAYVVGTLHMAAFGSLDWDMAGGSDLTPICLPHEKLWNDMKACLDLLVWVRVHFGFTFSWTNAGTAYTGVGANANWNIARAAAFAGLTPPVAGVAFNRCVGRGGTDIGAFTCTVYARTKIIESFNTNGDWTALTIIPAITDGWLATRIVPWQLNVGGSTTADDYDLTIAGVAHAGNPFTIEPLAAAQSDEDFQLTAAILAAIDITGVANAMECDFAGVLLADPGVGEWPGTSPPDVWSGGFTFYISNVYLKLSWE